MSVGRSRIGNSEQIRKGTTNSRVVCPFLERFVQERLLITQDDEGDFVSTKDLFTKYKTTISAWTNMDSEVGHVKHLVKRRSFQRQLASILRRKGVHGARARNYGRGYRRVKVIRLHRAKEVIDINTRISNFLQFGAVQPPIFEIRVLMDFGKCGFASRVILKGEVVAEFTGERITLEEAARREVVYIQKGNHTAIMLNVYSGARLVTVIDPWPTVESLPDNHHSVYFNHDLNHNIKLKSFNCSETGQIRAFFIATKDIPKTQQLLFNYQDKTAHFYRANTFG